MGLKSKHLTNSEIKPEETKSRGAAFCMYEAGLEHLSLHDSLSTFMKLFWKLTALMELITINDTDVNIHLFCPLETKE